MKFPKFLLLMGALTLASCSEILPSSQPEGDPSSQGNGNSSLVTGNGSQSGGHTGDHSSEGATVTPTPLEDGIGPILHCWNWSLKNIEDRLPSIKAAGFTAIQTSPLQPQKDFYAGGYWKNEWWKLYQPLGFEIATSNNALGTKDDLSSMIEEAHGLGIKVIVDVVTNHLAGGSGESFNGAVRNYEPEIYGQDLIHKGVGTVDDNDVKRLVQGHLGDYPDLKTDSPVVQDAVISLLKEYLDLGVDGFRFDAAKHIETSHDGEYASDYWENVLGTAREYAASHGQEVYIYGEILNTPGKDREISWYSDLMDVTDTVASWDILDAAQSGRADTLASPTISGYDGLLAGQSIYWAESHDTYANDGWGTRDVNQRTIDQAYAVASTRGGKSLYFARPGDSSLGEVGTDDWEGKAIQSVNSFASHYGSYPKEYSGDMSSYAATVYAEDETAVLLVDFKATYLSANLGLPDGEYYDEVSGRTFTSFNGFLGGELDPSGIAYLHGGSNGGAATPLSIGITPAPEGTFRGPIEVTVTETGATAASYSIDDGSPVSFDGSATFTLGGYEDATHSVRLEASNAERSLSKTYTYVFASDDDNPYLQKVINLPSEQTEGRVLAAWVWGGPAGERFVKGLLAGGTFSFYTEEGDAHFTLASFPAGTDSFSWDDKISQSGDIALDSSRIYDASGWSWR